MALTRATSLRVLVHADIILKRLKVSWAEFDAPRSRWDHLESRINMEAKIGERFDAVDQRLDGMDQRLNHRQQTLERIESQFDRSLTENQIP